MNLSPPEHVTRQIDAATLTHANWNLFVLACDEIEERGAVVLPIGAHRFAAKKLALDVLFEGILFAQTLNDENVNFAWAALVAVAPLSKLPLPDE